MREIFSGFFFKFALIRMEKKKEIEPFLYQGQVVDREFIELMEALMELR